MRTYVYGCILCPDSFVSTKILPENKHICPDCIRQIEEDYEDMQDQAEEEFYDSEY